MPNNTGTKVLFVSMYIEVLRVFLYFADHLSQNGYECVFICQYTDNAAKQENKKMAEAAGYEYELCRRNNVSSHHLWEKSFFFQLCLSFVYPFILLLKSRIQSSEIISRHLPSACIFGSESGILPRQLIHLCNKLEIPTFVYQWTFSSPSLRIALAEKSFHSPNSTTKKLMLRIATLPNSFLQISFGFRDSLRSETLFAGGGNCDKHLVISRASAKFYLRTGVKKSKLSIIGHPVFESLYKDSVTPKELKKQKVLEQYSIPTDSILILWANNQSRDAFTKYYTYDEMVASFRDKMEAISKIDKNIFIMFKLHPQWDQKEDFDFLKDFANVRVTKYANLFELNKVSDVFITNSSTAVNYSLILGVPVVTYGFPIWPTSDKYEILGGTLHANSLKEFVIYISGIIGNEAMVMDEYLLNKENYLKRNIGINDKLIMNNKDLPSCIAFERILGRYIGDT